MNEAITTGLYGKLPAYGDFIFRNLNSTFINAWDEWLQSFVAGSREQIGEGWLEIYLTSPIWRFVMSPGVIDNNAWAGMLMPSVDRVGRYFPISIVQPLPAQLSPVNMLSSQGDWFNQVETHCLDALDGKMDADQLIESLGRIPIHNHDGYHATGHLGEMGPQLFGLSPDQSGMQQLMPFWVNASLSSSLSSFSIWHTDGSELISPMLFCCQGLPPIGGIAAMLDGQWQKRNWKIPYNLVYQEAN